MKKIIVGLATVAFAIGVQASTVSWTITNVYGPTGDSKVSGTGAYTFFASDADTATAWITAITSAKNFTELSTELAKAGISYDMPLKYDNKGTMTDIPAGQYSYTEKYMGSLKTVSELGIADKKTYNAFMVIFDSKLADIKDGSKFYVSSVTEFTTGDGADDTAAAAFGSQSSYTQGSTTAWKTVGAVPEPTSGLLLLVGVAGLALRRRRS